MRIAWDEVGPFSLARKTGEPQPSVMLLADLADLNERLEQVSFVAGERFSAADITALVTIDFAKALDVLIPEGHRALTRWKDAVSARPSSSA